MGETGSTHAEVRHAYVGLQHFSRKTWRDHVGDLSVDGRIKLQWIWKK